MQLILQVAASLCGSYIGGSINFGAISVALGLAPGPLLAAAMAADMFAMAAYLLLISALPAPGAIQRAEQWPSATSAHAPSEHLGAQDASSAAALSQGATSADLPCLTADIIAWQWMVLVF